MGAVLAVLGMRGFAGAGAEGAVREVPQVRRWDRGVGQGGCWARWGCRAAVVAVGDGVGCWMHWGSPG